MRVALFVTCLLDLQRPSIGFAALETAGRGIPAPAGKTFQELYAARKRAKQ